MCHGVDDSVQIKIHGNGVGEVLDDDDKDGPAMETAGAESMTLLE
jgi:hypothetical protein